MTKQRILRLRTKIQESRSRLMESHPFFAKLLMYLRFVAVSDIKKISANAYGIYFSADFLDKLYQDETDYILCHQIMHIIMGHTWNPTDWAGDDYHMACDIIVNAMLYDMGFQKDSYPHLGTLQKQVPGSEGLPLDEMSPDEVCEFFGYSLYAFDKKTRANFFPDDNMWWKRSEDFSLDGTVILDIPKIEGNAKRDEEASSGGEGNGIFASSVSISNGEETKASLQSMWQERTAMALSLLEESEKNNFSNFPAFLKRLATVEKESILDWRKLLNDFLQEQISDYSFSPPDRRFADTDFFLPDFNEKDFAARDILFMVDTSGSVNDKELSAVYSEICGAIEQFNGKLNGKLGFFDVAVTDPIPFETVDDVLNIIPYGGGGTSFYAIFDYIKNHYSNDMPGCVVIFTDGNGYYP